MRFIPAAAACLAMLCACSQPLYGGELMRVAVADDIPSVTLKAPEGILALNAEQASRDRIVLSAGRLGAEPVRISSHGRYLQMNGKSYRGTIEVRKKRNGLLLAINEIDIEDYLLGVVAAEIPYDWETEALRAQAVAARTYALYEKRMAGSRPYHIKATVNSQVYSGKSGERETAARAVRDTEGVVITHDGEVIPAFFHSSCGGHTENAFELWSIDTPYLRGVECECQRISKYGAWEKRLGAEQIAAYLRKRGYPLEGIRDIAINGITPAGRVKQVLIRHAAGVTAVPAERFRGAIGYSAVPSVFFEIELSGNEVIISGRGLGHGVGLCQWGAREMARRGHDYKAILSHYYPGTSLATREIRKP